MFRTTDRKSTPVPSAKQVESAPVPTRRDWAEPAVWTERMRTALEQGVKGGVWFSLMDKVYAERNLHAGWGRVQANGGAAGVDRVTVAQYDERRDANLGKLSAALRDGSYHPQPVRRVMIPKPDGTQRPLGIPTVRDRVVQAALRNVLEPIFERDFAEHSYGFRPGRGCKDALRRVDALLKQGYTHVVDADLKSYFDTIPHERLMDRMRTKIADGRVLDLVERFLKQGVLDGLREWSPEEGTPQGAVISPLLANIYLDPLDHAMARHGWAMVRYADDFVILCRSPEEAECALTQVRQWTEANGLTLHPTKTRIVDARSEGFDFLGYHFQGGKRWPRKKSLAKLKDTLREKTKRTAGVALPVIIANVNRTLKGWFGYFQHSHWYTFSALDKWLRMRLRSILRRRQGRRGRGCGLDHHRWPNAFFAEQELFSLMQAHRLAVSSSRR